MRDYKEIKDAFEAIWVDAGYPVESIVNGFNGDVNSNHTPLLMYDSLNSKTNEIKDTETYTIELGLFMYYNENAPDQDKHFDDIWREIETIASAFFTELHGYNDKFEMGTEISKRRFGYGDTVNHMIPVHYTFNLTVHC